MRENETTWTENWRKWKKLKDHERTCKNMKENERNWKNMKEHERTWKKENVPVIFSMILRHHI